MEENKKHTSLKSSNETSFNAIIDNNATSADQITIAILFYDCTRYPILY